MPVLFVASLLTTFTVVAWIRVLVAGANAAVEGGATFGRILQRHTAHVARLLASLAVSQGALIAVIYLLAQWYSVMETKYDWATDLAFRDVLDQVIAYDRWTDPVKYVVLVLIATCSVTSLGAVSRISWMRDAGDLAMGAIKFAGLGLGILVAFAAAMTLLGAAVAQEDFEVALLPGLVASGLITAGLLAHWTSKSLHDLDRLPS